MDSVLSGSRQEQFKMKHLILLSTLFQYQADRIHFLLPPTPDPTLAPTYATDWTQWAGAIVGACLVGLTGEHMFFDRIVST